MKFHQPKASILIPDRVSVPTALERTTHLGIGAHPDDLEFMALHGILSCYRQDDQWFGGVTCTDGRGSTRDDGISDEALTVRRHAEQEEAARIGEYSFIAQLGYTSAEAKSTTDESMTRDLFNLLSAAQPEVVYTHNPADSHETHVAIMARVIAAIRRLPVDARPGRVLGCEVWRDLDWLPDEDKVVLNVSDHPELAEQLTAVFTSQMEGGKRYDRAVRGRAQAHATFLASHHADQMTAAWLAMDLTPLIVHETMSITQFINGHLARFKNNILANVMRWETK